LAGGRRNPRIRGLDPVADPSASIHHLSPDRARALIGYTVKYKAMCCFKAVRRGSPQSLAAGQSNSSDRVMKEINNWCPATALTHASRNE